MPESTQQFEATDRLAELIRKKRQVLLQLRELGKRELGFATEGDAGMLLQLATAKQHLVTALQMVERQLNPYRDDDPDRRAWRSQADRGACAEQADECRGLLAEVVTLEKAHERAMQQRRDAVAAQLRSAVSARQAAGAYQKYRVDSPTRETSPTPPLGSVNSTSTLDMASDLR